MNLRTQKLGDGRGTTWRGTFVHSVFLLAWVTVHGNIRFRVYGSYRSLAAQKEVIFDKATGHTKPYTHSPKRMNPQDKSFQPSNDAPGWDLKPGPQGLAANAV